MNISSVHTAELRELLYFFKEAGMEDAVNETAADAFAAMDSAAAESAWRQRAEQQQLRKAQQNIETETPKQKNPDMQSVTAGNIRQSSVQNSIRPSAEHISYEEWLAHAEKQASTAQNLAELKERIASFDGCSLKRTAKNTCIADGSRRYDLMLIGEGPGAEEDRQALPFVGRAGLLLNQILASVGRTRESLLQADAEAAPNSAAPPLQPVYITNAVFWRPPGNRTPTEQEIALCRPFLLRQIELVCPKVIMTLGGVAANALLGGRNSVLRLRGRFRIYKTADGREIALMPSLHPAYLLRTPLHKKLAWQDFLTVKMRLQE